MGYTTFKQMLQWCAEATKKSAEHNRPPLVNLANLVRQHIHLLYTEVKQTITKGSCFRVQCFPINCNDCHDVFHGFTLPWDFDGVEAVWRNDRPVPMFSKWREAVIGLRVNDTCRVTVIDQGSIFPTELEPNFLEPCRLMVRAEHPQDKGKEFRIKYTNQDHEEVTEIIKLLPEYQSTKDSVFSILRPAGVILPDDRKGRITLAKAVDREPISVYSPYEPAIPAYKRLKVTGVSPGDTIFVKGTSTYVPLFFDEDVVEFDNQLAIREFAKMFLYRDNDDPTQGFRAMAALAESTGKKYLLGEEAKEKGHAIQSVRIGGTAVNRSKLNNRRRRW